MTEDTGTTDRLRIRFAPTGSKAVALDVKVELVRMSEDGVAAVTDISNLVRAADVRLHVGEAATATLEVFVADVEVETLISDIKTLKVRGRRLPAWMKFRQIEVSCFDRLGVRRYVKGLRA